MKRRAPKSSAEKPKRLHFPGVRPLKPLLSRAAEEELSARQLELLDELERKLKDGELRELTMADIASQMSCSLRTLYAIAPSKDELLLTLVDRRLQRVGRAAIETLDPGLPALALLRAYLKKAHEAVQPESVALASDLARVAGGRRLLDAHAAYLTAVTQSLLDRAVADGEIPDVDTAAVAHVLGGLGREFARPDVSETLRDSANQTADEVAELILRGLEARR